MKRILFLTILVLAATLLLAACSATPTETPKASAPTAASNPAKATAAATPGYPAAADPSNNAQPTAKNDQPQVPGYPAPGLVVKITAADGSAKSLDSSSIGSLTTLKVSLEGKEIDGRLLIDALKTVGIAAFNKISVNGASGTLALTKDQAAQAYLVVAADGSLQLQVQGIGKDKWINGVQTIKID